MNENGAVVKRQDCAAFGDEILTTARASGLGYTSTDEIRQDYTGYEKDDESGLEYAQARYYNPRHGRFTSVDPLTASATIRNPQSLNRYSYVLNSPYKFTDPLGLAAMTSGSYCAQWCRNTGPMVDGSNIRGRDATFDHLTLGVEEDRETEAWWASIEQAAAGVSDANAAAFAFAYSHNWAIYKGVVEVSCKPSDKCQPGLKYNVTIFFSRELLLIDENDTQYVAQAAVLTIDITDENGIGIEGSMTETVTSADPVNQNKGVVKSNEGLFGDVFDAGGETWKKGDSNERQQAITRAMERKKNTSQKATFVITTKAKNGSSVQITIVMSRTAESVDQEGKLYEPLQDGLRYRFRFTDTTVSAAYGGGN